MNSISVTDSFPSICECNNKFAETGLFIYGKVDKKMYLLRCHENCDSKFYKTIYRLNCSNLNCNRAYLMEVL